MELYVIYDVDDGRQGRFGLIDGQQDPLTAAYSAGYYETPGTSIGNLTEGMEISDQACPNASGGPTAG